MNGAGVVDYLDRIGATRPSAPDADALAELQLRHLLAVPFENLSIHLGETILLGEDELFDKIVDRRRGGFCYELNGLFASLLHALGYDVTLVAARVFGAAGLGPPFDHLALLVDADDGGARGEKWLVDVGFGRHAQRPLRLADRGEQPDVEGVFRVRETADGDIEVLMDDVPQYRAELRPRQLVDCEPTCWWHATSPRSHFARGPVCSLLTGTGRVTLTHRLLVETDGGVRRERTLVDDEEVLATYRDRFGITLDRLPAAPKTDQA